MFVVTLKVGDAHGHVNPVKGLGPRVIARRFAEAGGWLYGLVNLLSWSVDLEIEVAEDYEKLYRMTIAAAEEMRKEGIIVPVFIGPHPAEAVSLVKRGFRIEEAVDIIVRAYELAANYVKRGLARGLGETGRPHWRVERRIMEMCTEIMGHVIELAAQLNVPVHLHLDPRKEAIHAAYNYAKRFAASKVIVHHARGELAYQAAKLGLTPSVPAKMSEILAARKAWGVMVVESDFLDDPKRPGAVVAPWSIKRIFIRLVRRGELSVETAYRILIENPARLYNISFTG